MKTPSTGDLLVERIIEILIRLYNKEHLSKAELALEYSVSERTIQRDIMQRLGYIFIRLFEKTGIVPNNNIIDTYIQIVKT